MIPESVPVERVSHAGLASNGGYGSKADLTAYILSVRPSIDAPNLTSTFSAVAIVAPYGRRQPVPQV